MECDDQMPVRSIQTIDQVDVHPGENGDRIIRLEGLQIFDEVHVRWPGEDGMG
jgi:hypothetical protein